MRRNAVVLAALMLTALVPQALAAQSTAMPIVSAPVRSFNDYTLGANISGPGTGVAVEGWYGKAFGRNDITFRAGLWDASGTSIFLIGADGRAPVITATESFPLDGAITVGLGGSFASSASAVYIPVGFSLGHKFDIKDSDIDIQPYGVPVLTFAFGDVGNDNLLLSLGLGVEFQFSERFALDLNGVLGDTDGVSVGFAYLR